MAVCPLYWTSRLKSRVRIVSRFWVKELLANCHPKGRKKIGGLRARCKRQQDLMFMTRR
jgi:hypothetical protein